LASPPVPSIPSLLRGRIVRPAEYLPSLSGSCPRTREAADTAPNRSR